MAPLNSRTADTKYFKKRCSELPVELQRMVMEKVVEINVYGWVVVWNPYYRSILFGTFGGPKGEAAAFVRRAESAKMMHGVVLKTAIRQEKILFNRAKRLFICQDAAKNFRRKCMLDLELILYAMGGFLRKGDGIPRNVAPIEPGCFALLLLFV
jgi:hypothetical protein